jgi:hypothetical protein
MKRLYEMGGDIINDFMPTGAVGSGTAMPNSMLENNSQVDAIGDKKKRKKTDADRRNAKWQRGAKNKRKPCPSCQ